MGKFSVVEYRNVNDFKYGSFDVYLKSDEIIISGILKKNSSRSRYMSVRRREHYAFHEAE
jgi:CO/xanthine dehydrogenase FAD-binding subunit